MMKMAKARQIDRTGRLQSTPGPGFAGLKDLKDLKKSPGGEEK